MQINVLRLTDALFESVVSNARTPILIDFWASWCTPCKMLEPLLEELAAEYAGVITVGSLNVDQNPETASRFAIQGVPCIVLLDESGIVVEKRVGSQSKSQLKGMIEKHVGA